MRKARGGEGRGQTQAAMAHPTRGHGLPCERMERTARKMATEKEKKNTPPVLFCPPVYRQRSTQAHEWSSYGGCSLCFPKKL